MIENDINALILDTCFKVKVTRRDVLRKFTNIISVPYGELNGLLKYEGPAFYLASKRGWDADGYIIDNDTCIVTGFRPFGNIFPAHALNDAFNCYAKRDDTPDRCKYLLSAYIKAVI